MPEVSISGRQLERLAAAFMPIMHRMHHLAMEVSKTTDFSLPQMRVLMLLWQQGTVSVNEVKKQLNTAQSTASEMVERLVQMQLIDREKDSADRRKTNLNLTNKARHILDSQYDTMQSVYKKMLTALKSDEQEKLVKAFETISEIMNRPQNTEIVQKK